MGAVLALTMMAVGALYAAVAGQVFFVMAAMTLVAIFFQQILMFLMPAGGAPPSVEPSAELIARLLDEDYDGDGYGDANASLQTACDPPVKSAANNDDCDDDKNADDYNYCNYDCY